MSILETVAKELEFNPNLDFGSIDLSLNDPKGLRVEETPIIYLFKPGSIYPAKHRGPMKKLHILKFMHTHMGKKLNEYVIQPDVTVVDTIDVYRSVYDADM